MKVHLYLRVTDPCGRAYWNLSVAPYILTDYYYLEILKVGKVTGNMIIALVKL